MKKSTIILLSGPSCSGKTTLSQAVQREMSSRGLSFLNVEADRLLPQLPQCWPPKDLAAEESVLNALVECVLAFAREGFDLIVDGILPYKDPQRADLIVGSLRQFHLFYVGIHCGLEVLEERERNRPDRVKGWAARQFRDLHDGARYDLELDTTSTAASENAKFLVETLLKQCGANAGANKAMHTDADKPRR